MGRTLEGELGKLRRLKSEHVLEKIASHEDEKSAIAAIFERINEGRIQFEVCIGFIGRPPWLTYATPSSTQTSGCSRRRSR
jgi:hypothetical protein